MPELSIIVLNYNTKQITIDCLRSIDRNYPKSRVEVQLVDNASTDGSVETIKKLKLKNYKVNVVKNQSNLGFAAGNNVGIRKAKAKHILLLNSDTLVTEGAIDRLIKYAERLPEAGVIGAKLLNQDRSIQPSVYRLPTIWRTIAQYWLNNKGLLDKYYPLRNGAQEVEAVVGAAFLITSSALKKVGLMNEKYFMYFEDLDYCRAARKKGLKIYYVPDVEIVHLHGASGKSLIESGSQWKRLIPSSKTYHGLFRYYILYFITKSAQLTKK